MAKVNIGKAVINSLTGAGMASSGESSGNIDYDHHNAEFDKQSHIGRSTGRLRSSNMMREAISEFYGSKKDNSKVQRFVVGLKDDTDNPDDILG